MYIVYTDHADYGLLFEEKKQETHMMMTNPRDAFRGHSKPSNMVGLPFDVLGIVFC